MGLISGVDREMEIGTLSGRRINLHDPQPDDFAIGDIAQPLANLCRWGGQVQRFYSVAEHCCLVSDAVYAMSGGDHAKAFAGLMHDASEAYVRDLPSPIKSALPVYIELEERIQQVMSEVFGYQWPWPREVSEADIAIRYDEQEALRRLCVKRTVGGGRRRAVGFKGLDVKIWGWLPRTAQQEFMHRFHYLTEKVKPAA